MTPSQPLGFRPKTRVIRKVHPRQTPRDGFLLRSTPHGELLQQPIHRPLQHTSGLFPATRLLRGGRITLLLYGSCCAVGPLLYVLREGEFVAGGMAPTRRGDAEHPQRHCAHNEHDRPGHPHSGGDEHADEQHEQPDEHHAADSSRGRLDAIVSRQPGSALRKGADVCGRSCCHCLLYTMCIRDSAKTGDRPVAVRPPPLQVVPSCQCGPTMLPSTGTQPSHTGHLPRFTSIPQPPPRPVPRSATVIVLAEQACTRNS